MVLPLSSTSDGVKLELALDVACCPLASTLASGSMSTTLPAPSVNAPPTVASLVVTAPGTPTAPPRASRKTEPSCATLVVALMRPLWLTAMPTSVVLPVGVLMTPPCRLATLPLPLPTSTSRPLTAGIAEFTSDAYITSLVGRFRNTWSPAPSTAWPFGVVIVPAFCTTLLANRNTRPPLGVVICAPGSTSTKLFAPGSRLAGVVPTAAKGPKV